MLLFYLIPKPSAQLKLESRFVCHTSIFCSDLKSTLLAQLLSYPPLSSGFCCVVVVVVVMAKVNNNKTKRLAVLKPANLASEYHPSLSLSSKVSTL